MATIDSDEVGKGSRSEVNDPFDAVPVIAPGVEARQDGQEHFQVRRTSKKKSGLAGVLARKFGFERAVRANLDKMGSFYWRQIDGRKDLARIEKKLRRHFRLSRQQSRGATVKFTKALMERGLILLKVTRKEG